MTSKTSQGGKPVVPDAEGPVTTGKVPQPGADAPAGSQPTSPSGVPPGPPPAKGRA